MTKKNGLWKMIAVLLVSSMVLISCATLTWNNPVTETGLKSALETALKNANAQEVASYTILFGFLHLGKSSFEGLVIAAARSGKSVHVLKARNLFFTSVIAYAN